MRTLASLTSLLKTNKTGPLFKVLTVLFILIQIPLARAESAAFDYVTLAELNQQAHVLWNHMVQRHGPARAAQTLRTNPPVEVRQLGQSLHQFLLSSHVHFESLKNFGDKRQIETSMGVKMTPLLRVLLLNSVALDLNEVVDETKPFILSPHSHRGNLVKLYNFAFPRGVLFRPKAEDLSHLDLSKLMVLARTSALAALLLSGTAQLQCSELIDLGWTIQVYKQIGSQAAGFSETPLLVEAASVSRDYYDCVISYSDARINELAASGKIVQAMTDGSMDKELDGVGGEIFTKKQILNIAARLLGQEG